MTRNRSNAMNPLTSPLPSPEKIAALSPQQSPALSPQQSPVLSPQSSPALGPKKEELKEVVEMKAARTASTQLMGDIIKDFHESKNKEETILKWMRVLCACYKANDHQTMMAVFAGISSSGVEKNYQTTDGKGYETTEAIRHSPVKPFKLRDILLTSHPELKEACDFSSRMLRDSAAYSLYNKHEKVSDVIPEPICFIAAYDRLKESKSLDGCCLHILPKFPDVKDLEKYKHSLVLVEKNLVYITPDGKTQQIKINNFEKFSQLLKEMNKDNLSSIQLKSDQTSKLLQIEKKSNDPIKDVLGLWNKCKHESPSEMISKAHRLEKIEAIQIKLQHHLSELIAQTQSAFGLLSPRKDARADKIAVLKACIKYLNHEIDRDDFVEIVRGHPKYNEAVKKSATTKLVDEVVGFVSLEEATLSEDAKASPPSSPSMSPKS